MAIPARVLPFRFQEPAAPYDGVYEARQLLYKLLAEIESGLLVPRACAVMLVDETSTQHFVPVVDTAGLSRPEVIAFLDIARLMTIEDWRNP